MIYDVIIIGCGAAGFASARAALQNHKTVLMLDHAAKALQKVHVSGGGRCNFSNLTISQDNYVSLYAPFCCYALKAFGCQDFIQLMKKHNLGFEKKNKTQLFSQAGSAALVNMLKTEATGADQLYEVEVKNVCKEELFIVKTNVGVFEAKNLIIATGGMSFANLGASDLGYKIGKQFGHKVVPIRAGLVGLNLKEEVLKTVAELQGVAVKALVKTQDFEVYDQMLFTHFGLSGPAILQASLYWQNGQEICINFAPEHDIIKLLKEKRDSARGTKISTVLSKIFPNALAAFFVKDKDIFISEASNKLIIELAQRINNWRITPVSSQGFKAAEVTIGGVDVTEVEETTMQSKKVKGLFFAGEVLDVAGQLGGYNLQWAWSSGDLAGRNIQ